MIEVGQRVVKIAEDEGRRAGFRRFKLSAHANVKVNGSTVQCEIQGTPVGPWVWATIGTKRHKIPRQRKGGKPRYLKGASYEHPVRTPPPITHPGTTGKGGWTKVVRRAQDEFPSVFQQAVHEVVT